MTFSAAGWFRRLRSRQSGTVDPVRAGLDIEAARQDERNSAEAIHRTSVQMLNRMADALERRNAKARAGLGPMPRIKPR